jgi:hypothetical protein
MRYAGIEIASEIHVLAVITEDGGVELKATPFGEYAAGYQKALALLGSAGEVLIAIAGNGGRADRKGRQTCKRPGGE